MWSINIIIDRKKKGFVRVYNWRGRCVSSHLKGMGPTVYEKVAIGDGGDFQRLMLCTGIEYHCYPLTQTTIIINLSI